MHIRNSLVSYCARTTSCHYAAPASEFPATDSLPQPLQILQTLGQLGEQLDVHTDPACGRPHHHIKRCNSHHSHCRRGSPAVERDGPERLPARTVRAAARDPRLEGQACLPDGGRARQPKDHSGVICEPGQQAPTAVPGDPRGRDEDHAAAGRRCLAARKV